jgi:hypothetical protein
MKIKLDMSKMTIGDMEDFEEVAGAPMSSMSQYRKEDENGEVTAVGMPIKFMTALIYIGKRQEDPAFTLKDTRRLKINDLEFEIVGEDDTPLDESS